jgi:alpha-D-xyloside xylohydrolase
MPSSRLAGSLRLVAALAAVMLAASGCGSSRGPQAISVSAHDLTIRISDGRRTVTELGGGRAPFVFWSGDGAEYEATRVLGQVTRGATTTYRYATDAPGHEMVVSVDHTAMEAHIRYAVRGTGDVSAVGFSMTASPAGHYLGTGQRDGWVDLARTVQPLKVYNGCGSSSPSPFFVSTDGFGAWASTTAVGRIAFPAAVDDSNFACDLGTESCSVGPAIDAVRWCFKARSVDMTIAAGTLPQLLTAHARAVGLPRAPWLPQLALIK